MSEHSPATFGFSSNDHAPQDVKNVNAGDLKAVEFRDVQKVNESLGESGLFDINQSSTVQKPASTLQDIRHEFSDGLLFIWAMFLQEYKKLTWIEVWEFIKLRFPPLAWLPEYTFEKFRLDLTAGLVVGCMLIPQAMAYASVAGLPAQNGLYTGFTPLILYSCLGTSRQMGVGPVALISTLVSQGVPACSKVCFPKAGFKSFTVVDPYPSCPSKCTNSTLDWNPEYQSMASGVALLVGIIMVVLAPVLGWFMNFVPSPVIMGFTSGGGIIIALGQLKDVMGYSIRKDTLQQGVYDFFAYLNQTQGITCGMGVGAAVFLFIIRKLGQGRILWWKVKMPPWVKQVVLLPWAFGLVVLYTGVSARYNLVSKGVAIVGTVPAGLPPLKVPNNFSNNLGSIISVTITIVIVGYLESIAVETKFANQFKYQINPTQESFAQGWANIFAGLTSAYPAVGSFSRSSTNAAYGAKTPMCNFIAAMVIMICLLVLTPYLYHMPKMILASIVIVAALSLVEFPEFVYLFRTNKFEFVIIMLTFLLVLFYSLEMGIYVAVGVCGFVVLFQATQPKVTMIGDNRIFIYLPGSTSLIQQKETDAKAVTEYMDAETDENLLLCHIEGGLIYAAAGQVKRVLTHKLTVLSKTRKVEKFVFDLGDMSFSDSTALKALIGIVEDLQARSVAVSIVGPPKGLLILMPHARVHKKFCKVPLFKDMHELHQSGWLKAAPEVALSVAPDSTTARDVGVHDQGSGVVGELSSYDSASVATWPTLTVDGEKLTGVA